jgi:hypothetical protein
MPKVEATVDTLVEISNLVYMGQLKNLKINRYKTGANAGKLFAEYSKKDRIVAFDTSTVNKRVVVSDMLKKAAKALAEGKHIELNVHKRDAAKELYTHMLIIREV